MVIGTHALMQDGVEFARLGLVIVDEQHRFGVHQRMALLEKGREQQTPHQLIMTATPIPRTLAMTAYAGLEVSVIDELPAGRKPITTVAVGNERRGEVVRRVAAACAEGRQAYWVCTLIEESDAIQAQAAEAVAEELRAALGGREVGLVHQLRGRGGRGAVQSSCVLLYTAPLGDLARQRLDIMRQTTDGFRIAEKDLELRGPGEVLGTRQTGMLQFRVADLARDAHLLQRIPPVADSLLRHHPEQVDRLIHRWVGDAARFAGV